MEGIPPPELLAYSHTTVLIKSVFQQMYHKRFERNWLEARQLFPDQRAKQIWVAVRSGDEWFKHRKRPDRSWTTQAFDLGSDPGATRDVFDPGDPRHVSIREGLLAYKSMLVSGYNAQQEEAIRHRLSDQQDGELLRDLGYIE